MLITIVDRSLPFDGTTREHTPQGPSQKAVAELAEALARREHAVRVFNLCEKATAANGVSWTPLSEAAAARTDLLIAHQDPSLLDTVSDADRRVLWLTRPGTALARPEAFAAAARHRPVLVYQGESHVPTIPDGLLGLDGARIPIGVAAPFLEAPAPSPSVTPMAVATTHPLLGLEWLLGIWRRRVHARLPWAELHVVSAALSRPDAGLLPEGPWRRIHALARAAEKAGVKLIPPATDRATAKMLGRMRVHLYPSDAREVLAATLAETQATGIPAVARPLGAVNDRILDGKTGFVTADEETFVDYTIRLLDDQATFSRLSEHAVAEQRGRPWDRVAEDFEELTQ